MKTAVIIPARMKSTRFPGKPLAPILGKPMILYVAELSAKAVGIENTYIATDDQLIADLVESHGFQSVLTSESCLTGTDRLAEAVEQIEADIFINVQGDEPMLNPESINAIIEIKLKQPESIINGMGKLAKDEDPNDVDIPKVIVNENNDLVYMSRSAIPGYKSESKKPKHWYKQICIYAFNKEQLRSFQKFGRKSTLESHEDIEILRFLEMGYPISMVEIDHPSLAVDRPEDVAIVEDALRAKSRTSH